MKRQTSKVLGLKQTGFELKRMELMRYHNDLYRTASGGDVSTWIAVMMAIMIAPMSFIKPENSKQKEE